MKITLLFVLSILIALPLYSQTQKHAVKGLVVEEITNNPIEGVLIFNVDNHQYVGISDKNGNFKFQMEQGRKLLQFEQLGFNPIVVEVDVRPITEHLSISLESSPIKINDVTVIGSKPEPIGAKKFKPEQASRYAGSLGDPARMVRSFAGVQALNDSRNDIIIRGNSPIGLQWRVDGFEIPNPNHHGAMGLTGSTVTLLNTNLLSSSDFYLGGWGANYSNATSGIFDLNMRGQNDIKKDLYWFQVGWNGFEVGAEGNFDKKKKTTYMVDYRYSFLGLMSKMGLDMGLTPEYQDFTFKTTSQIGDNHSLDFLGIWGDSHIVLESDNDFTNMSQHVKTGSQTILGGLTHKYKIKDNQSLTSRLSYVRSDVYTDVSQDSKLIMKEKSNEGKYSFNSEYLLRIEINKILTVGAYYDLYDINYNESVKIDDAFNVINDENGNMSLIRGYVQYQTYIADKIKTTIGINSSYLTLNGCYSIEPRVSLKYSFDSAKSLSLAVGKYSQMQPRTIYFTKNKEGVNTNEELGFTKNIQTILSYSWAFSPQWHLRAEAYYQYLYDVPVVNDPNSTLSLLNFGADYYMPRPTNLINKGRGYNYGIEVTVEKYFQNNFYLLTNGSLYSSKYTTGFNDIKYSTVFNGNFMVNLTGGYEWNINNNHTLLFDIKGSIAGGQRYTPLDEDASMAAVAAGKTDEDTFVYDYSKTNSLQLPSYMRADLKITYRVNAPKFIYDLSIDFQNFTNHKNPQLVNYNITATDVEQVIYNQQGFLPMVTFKITW